MTGWCRGSLPCTSNAGCFWPVFSSPELTQFTSPVFYFFPNCLVSPNFPTFTYVWNIQTSSTWLWSQVVFLGQCLRHVLVPIPQVPTSFTGSFLMWEGMWQRKVDSVCPVWNWPWRRPQREEAEAVFPRLKGEMETVFPMRERSCCILQCTFLAFYTSTLSLATVTFSC